MRLIFCLMMNMKVFYKLIVLFLMGFSRHVQYNIFVTSEGRSQNEVRDLTDLTGSNTTHKIYYAFNVPRQLTRFLSQVSLFLI